MVENWLVKEMDDEAKQETVMSLYETMQEMVVSLCLGEGVDVVKDSSMKITCLKLT